MKSSHISFAIVFVLAAFQVVASQNVCSRVSQIKNLPFKGESGLDANYDAMIDAGKSAMPCLIAKITHDTNMRHPGPDPGYPGIHVRVGDVACFVLCDIAKTDFDFVLLFR